MDELGSGWLPSPLSTNGFIFFNQYVDEMGSGWLPSPLSTNDCLSRPPNEESALFRTLNGECVVLFS